MSVTFPTMGAGTYSGFWNTSGDATQYSPIPRSQQGWRSKLEWQLATLLGKQQMREINALLNGLIGAAAGSNVTKTYARVQTPSGPSGTVPVPTSTGEMGGLVPIETVTVINRNTTAADIAYLKSLTDGTMRKGGASITYAVDASGVGAGNGGKNSQLGW